MPIFSRSRKLRLCGTASQPQSAMQSATQSFYSRSHDAVIRVYDEAGNVIETQDPHWRFQRVVKWACLRAAF